jgi:hypothetical protein
LVISTPSLYAKERHEAGSLIISARTLDAVEPIKEPQADSTGNVENHLPDLDLKIILLSDFCHVALSPLTQTVSVS